MARKTVKKGKKISSKSPKKRGKMDLVIPESVSFEYIKSNLFRVIRVDGVHGGVTPKANAIQMAFFNERQPIPKKEVYSIDMKHGGLGEMKEKDSRHCIVREVEIETIMDVETAKVLRDWLNDKINQAEELREMTRGD
jgi:hypothetical protein